MFNKIKSVTPQEDYVLSVVFENAEERFYDVKPLFDKWDVFKDLKTVSGLFDAVKVDQGGYGVSWNDSIDLSCDELWENGIVPELTEGKKKISKAQQASVNKYVRNNYDRTELTLKPKGEKKRLQAIAKEKGFSSLNSFVVAAIEEKIEREGKE